ncbi:branched-chain amino acid ABC transporter permease [Maritimibacter sp. 55A14]|uniref:branched-chain amino acid ABC transporter permease n=1 Tax=Maritimibacter sp. 55A14 TaxID=2174844 RepID=UPI000D61795F|nr:branched-chain amino acid ABC transporter permease [Maritimibacter sp. 55A14]PWE31281.1 branched-chain amino acid ABC transporter permease [Maritimibacter sp. 55A14]
MDSATLLQTFANSIVAGSIYAVIAVGLAMAFGVMKMANFAHGEFFMVGAYTVYVCYGLMGWPFPVAVLMAIPVVALLGVATERFIFRPTRENVLAGFMATAGLALILQVLIGQIWGVGLMRSVPTPYMGALDLGGVRIGWQRVLVIPSAIAMLFALWYFLYHAKAGKALRACAQDPETARLQGININRMTMLAMAISGALAGLAGALMAPIHPVTPYMGHGIILTAFIVVVMGGMESIAGAILAAVLLGFIHTFVTTLSDAVTAQMVGVACMAVVLIVRPQGLLGRVKA